MELTDQHTTDIECPIDNIIVHESQSCWCENKSAILFLLSATLGFVWVGLNLGGFV